MVVERIVMRGFSAVINPLANARVLVLALSGEYLRGRDYGNAMIGVIEPMHEEVCIGIVGTNGPNRPVVPTVSPNRSIKKTIGKNIGNFTDSNQFGMMRGHPWGGSLIISIITVIITVILTFVRNPHRRGIFALVKLLLGSGLRLWWGCGMDIAKELGQTCWIFVAEELLWCLFFRERCRLVPLLRFDFSFVSFPRICAIF